MSSTEKKYTTENANSHTFMKSAVESLSPEDREKYKKIGEYMYNTIDYEQQKILDDLPTPVSESIAYIEIGIKSGLLPCDLEDEEVEMMIQTYGNTWYKRYGFSDNDIPTYQKNRSNR